MSAYQQIAEKLNHADAVLIGASNGLSITEGLHLFADNATFDELFGDLKQKYGLRCILQGMSAQWPTEEEMWGFWSRLVHRYCSNYTATPVMKDLKAIVGDKDYFIVTSNGECHFEMSGFAPEKIYEIEGNWLTMRCADGCHDTVYPSLSKLENMAAAERDGRVPMVLLPRCPKCGGPMTVNMAGGAGFLPDLSARQRYQAFLERHHGNRLVILELGIGPRNQLIKAPLMRLAAQEPNATYITINLGEIYIPQEIQDKSFGLDGYLDETLAQLQQVYEV